MLRTLIAVLALGLLGAAPCAAQSASAQGTPAADSLTLSPGDVLRIEIWREKDLSGEFPVDARGTVTLPLLGERQVTGVPLGRLRDQLLADYRQSLRNPSITIIPLRRLNVLGEVNKPGTYLVDPTVSLAGAVAMAQGTTPLGDLRRIRIVRDGVVLRSRVAPESTLSVEGVRSGDQVFVDRRGWLDRNGGFLTSAVVSTALSITAALILRN